eukprot:1314947-Lingulodinium_polyedra.AAC.1
MGGRAAGLVGWRGLVQTVAQHGGAQMEANPSGDLLQCRVPHRQAVGRRDRACCAAAWPGGE